MTRLVDLSHVIEHGLVTYKGLPAPHICDYLSRAASRAAYPPGTEFQIGRIDMVGNTGTYVDTPFHRYADGDDLAAVGLDRLADLPGLRVTARAQAVDVDAFAGLEVSGCAVLVHTGWARHWGTARYFEDHPFLTEAAAQWLADAGAVLVGIDSHNIDDTRTNARPVHSLLLARGVPIVEHMTALDALSTRGFRFSAVPPRIAGFGTFPVRAFARVVD